jgi:RNA polymerase sigma factor for flagellar operon FliA
MTTDERNDLVLEHLEIVKKGVHRIVGRIPALVDTDDLASDGVLGLMDAIDKFEPDRAVKFKTYAEVRVRGAILDSLRRLDWAPRALRRRGREVNRAFDQISQKFGRRATDEELAAALGETLEGLHALVDQLDSLSIGSFDPMETDEGQMDLSAELATIDPHILLDADEITRILAQAVEELPGRERRVVELYYYEGMPMKAIASELIVHESRVSQLHARAVHRLRSKLEPFGITDLDR